jgi:hypothetical protein
LTKKSPSQSGGAGGRAATMSQGAIASPANLLKAGQKTEKSMVFQ